MTTLKLLEKQIKKSFGKRCKDYNPFCVACVMWHAYDTLKEGLDKSDKNGKWKNRLAFDPDYPSAILGGVFILLQGNYIFCPR